MDYLLSILAIVALIWAAIAAVIWVAVRQLRGAVDRAISSFAERQQSHVRRLLDALEELQRRQADAESRIQVLTNANRTLVVQVTAMRERLGLDSDGRADADRVIH